MRKIFSLTIYNFKVLSKEPLVLFFNILFPILWSVIAINFSENYASSQESAIYYFSAIITLNLLTFTIISLPITIASSRLRNINKQMAMLSIKKVHFLLAFLMTNITSFIVMFWLIFITHVIANDLQLSATIAYLFLLFLVFFVPFFYTGILIGSVFKSISSTQAFAQMIFFIILLTSGITFSAESAGSWFIYLQKITPGGNLLLLMNQIIFQIKIINDLFPLIYLIIFAVLIIIFANYFFRFT